MQYLLLGLAALLLFLLAARVYTAANPQVLVRQLRIGAGVAALAGAGFLVFRGLVGYAMSLAALGSWLLWGGGAFSWGGFSGSAQKSPGQTSGVVTEHLEVELDHDTGDISGRVLKGSFAGRQLEELAPIEMAWEGKSVGEICRQIKDPNRNGGRNLALLHEHMAHDDLVAWGWRPGAGREPAPGSQALLGELIQAWIDTGAQCP